MGWGRCRSAGAVALRAIPTLRQKTRRRMGHPAESLKRSLLWDGGGSALNDRPNLWLGIGVVFGHRHLGQLQRYVRDVAILDQDTGACVSKCLGRLQRSVRIGAFRDAIRQLAYVSLCRG